MAMPAAQWQPSTELQLGAEMGTRAEARRI
jgi:hypothetical protein